MNYITHGVIAIMHYVGSRKSQTDPLASIPLLRSAAAIMRPVHWPAPTLSTPHVNPAYYLPPTEQEKRRRDLVNAEAALAEITRALNGARAGIGEANRTSTAPVVSGGRVLMPPLRFSPERMRERKSYAFRLLNQRRGQVSATRRRVEAARVALGLPTLASLEERAVTREAVRASKRVPVSSIA